MLIFFTLKKKVGVYLFMVNILPKFKYYQKWEIYFYFLHESKPLPGDSHPTSIYKVSAQTNPPFLLYRSLLNSNSYHVFFLFVVLLERSPCCPLSVAAFERCIGCQWRIINLIQTMRSQISLRKFKTLTCLCLLLFKITLCCEMCRKSTHSGAVSFFFFLFFCFVIFL